MSSEKNNTDKSFERERQSSHEKQGNARYPQEINEYSRIRAMTENSKKNRQNIKASIPKSLGRPTMHGKPSASNSQSTRPNDKGKSNNGNPPKARQDERNRRDTVSQRNGQTSPRPPANIKTQGESSKNKIERPPRPIEKQPPVLKNEKPASRQHVPKRPKKPSKPVKSAKPMSAAKRRRKNLLIYSAMIFVVLIIGIILSLTVFFNIDTITVEGKTRYSEEDIIAASGVSKDTNLLLCDTESGVDKIKEQFPYIESVKIQKKLFNSVVIEVTEAKPATAILSDGQYVILSETGKAVELLGKNKYNVPLIKGAELKMIKLGSPVEYKLDSIERIIESVVTAISENDISSISVIDVSSPANIKLTYDNRLTIVLGMPEDIGYKLKTAKTLIDDKLEKDAGGTVDVSMCNTGGKYSYYDPGTGSSDSKANNKNNSSKANEE